MKIKVKVFCKAKSRERSCVESASAEIEISSAATPITQSDVASELGEKLFAVLPSMKKDKPS